MPKVYEHKMTLLHVQQLVAAGQQSSRCRQLLARVQGMVRRFAAGLRPDGLAGSTLGTVGEVKGESSPAVQRLRNSKTSLARNGAAIVGALALLGAVSVNLRTQFELRVSPCCILSGRAARVTLRGRYDHAAVGGTVCFVIDGVEYHTSCWQSDEETAPLVVRTFLLEHEGEYVAVMQTADGKVHTTPQTLVLQ